MKSKIKDLIKKEYVYPETNDPNFQNKIYKKREFYYHKIPDNIKLDSYPEIKKFRDEICGGKLSLYSHQSFLANFINPNTPYTGLLIFHGTGTGKTITAISIAENFKDIVIKYNTKIYVLVPNQLLKENFKDEIIKFTGQDYIKESLNKLGYIDENEAKRAKNIALKTALQYYNIMTHRGFYKKVLGDKIKNTTESKAKYRLTETGEIQRDLSSADKIEHLNNTILIIDEAHQFTGNEHGDALKLIIKKSKNLKIILLTATPMKNLGSDIIELINYIRPINDPIKREFVFNKNRNYLMDLKPAGDEYLKKMCNGYISYYRGANPLLFAKKVEMGEMPPGLIFTKCIRCKMKKFQQKTYDIVSDNSEDTLERKSSAVANFVFPGLSQDKKSIVGYFGENGINVIMSNLNTDKTLYLSMLNKKFFNNKIKKIEDIVYINSKNSIGGLIFKKKYIDMFSSKFSTIFNNIDDLIDGKKGPKTIFVYSNLVKVGIEMMEQILLENGYLEFDDQMKYDIKDDTIDYYTGKTYTEFKKTEKKNFYPATFIKMTGKQEDDDQDSYEIKKKIFDKHYNNHNNYQGKFLKIILGSKVMMEGITLENVGEVHIMDVYFTLGRLDQVIGRAIRQCKHYKITNEKNKFPQVNIYRYVVKTDGKLSSEEDLYRKAEIKYLLIKKVERCLKEIAIDCPINYPGNVFREEVLENKNCKQPKIGNLKLNKTDKFCPGKCDFLNCDYQCHDKKLNLKYYNKDSLLYKKIYKDKLDYSTFNEELAKNEIKIALNKIKNLYKIRYVYTLDEIILKVKESYSGEKYELFENFFVYQALNKLIPITENDFNNFKDFLYDRYNISGYLIYRANYYIFQPFHESEIVPMFYRRNFNRELVKELSLFNYLKNSHSLIEDNQINTITSKKLIYDFDTNKNYYNDKKEYKIIGIIDYSKSLKEDIFRIREERSKILNKKRGTGIFSEKGAICHTSKDKHKLKKIFKILDIKFNKKHTRIDMCNKLIRKKLLYLEKYSNNNLIYMIIPYNHKKYIFPYNLKDRIKYIENEIKKLEKSNIKFNIKKMNDGIFENKRNKIYIKYQINFTYNKKENKKTLELLNKYNFIKNKNKWISIIE